MRRNDGISRGGHPLNFSTTRRNYSTLRANWAPPTDDLSSAFWQASQQAELERQQAELAQQTRLRRFAVLLGVSIFLTFVALLYGWQASLNEQQARLDEQIALLRQGEWTASVAAAGLYHTTGLNSFNLADRLARAEVRGNASDVAIEDAIEHFHCTFVTLPNDYRNQYALPATTPPANNPCLPALLATRTFTDTTLRSASIWYNDLGTTCLRDDDFACAISNLEAAVTTGERLDEDPTEISRARDMLILFNNLAVAYRNNL